MITLNRIEDSITGSVNMVTFGVRYTPEKWKTMTELKANADAAETMEDLKLIIEQFNILTKESYKEIVETACKDLLVNENTGHFYLKLKNGKASLRAIPAPFVERILTSVEKGIDPQPVIKACIRFMKNPNFSDKKFDRFAKYVNYQSVDPVFRDKLMTEEGVSFDVATQRATVYQTPITQEGLICTYKVSKELLEKFILDAEGNRKTTARYGADIDEDTGEITKQIPAEVEDRVFYPAVQGLNGGDAFFCETFGGTAKLGHLIRVGARIYLEKWSQVNTNDDVSCVKGLHCGNLDYIAQYSRQPGVETHEVFIDPMNIGAITDDGSGALRVLEYFVHKSKAGENRGIYHSSKYAAMTDAQWEIMKAEAVKNAQQHQDEVDKQAEELEGL